MAKAPRLAAAQLRALGALKSLPQIDRFYLAGTSAIALHLGHRRSEDLALFSRDEDVSLPRLKRALVQLRGAKVVGETDVMVQLDLSNVPVDLVKYPHPPLQPLVKGPSGIWVANLGDLAAMKLSAISRRGIKRDFWDLYAINKAGVDLPTAAQIYLQRFGRSEADLYHVQRALTWFEDAEADPITPAGLTPALWRRIQKHFVERAPELLNS